MSNESPKRLMCLGCGCLYDEARGLPEHGLAPGTRWADIPDDWACPDCGTPSTALKWSRCPMPWLSPYTEPPPRTASTTPQETIMNSSFVVRASEARL